MSLTPTGGGLVRDEMYTHLSANDVHRDDFLAGLAGF